MKLNKSAYLFAAALVAGTVGMTSCSSEEIIDDAAVAGTENTVTLSMSVANRATRATADAVNMGTKMQTISNIAVVPMIDASYLNPIIMGSLSDFTTNDGTTTGTITKTTTLNSNVNRFKVYGNIDAVDGGNAFDESKTFTGFNISVGGQTTLGTEANQKTVYNPHGLYYYGYVGYDDAPEVDRISVSSDATGTGATSLTGGTAIGKNKYVKISNVNYAVGVLATAVFNADNSNKYITKVEDQSTELVSSENVKFKGIIIDKQSKTLDQDFEQVTSEGLVSIYDFTLNTNGTGFQTGNNISASNNKSNANIYTIVAATGENKDGEEGDIVTGNLVFTLQQGYILTLKNGTKIDASSAPVDFYLAFSLNPDEANNKAVFMKDYSTFFNAKVKNWGLASDEPIEVTDVNLAVEVNLDWNEGIVYDQEI